MAALLRGLRVGRALRGFGSGEPRLATWSLSVGISQKLRDLTLVIVYIDLGLNRERTWELASQPMSL